MDSFSFQATEPASLLQTSQNPRLCHGVDRVHHFTVPLKTQFSSPHIDEQFLGTECSSCPLQNHQAQSAHSADQAL